MMKIRYEYIRSDNVINYEFEGDKIHADYIEYELVFGKTLDEPTHLVEKGSYSDTFDFTDMPDGRLEIFDENTGEWLIESELPENPIISAERKDGALWVALVVFFSGSEIDDERKLDWIDVRGVESDGEIPMEND